MRYYDEIYITEEIEVEITEGDRPENLRLENSIGDRMKIVVSPDEDNYSGLDGLDCGEKSLLNYAYKNQDVLLILDEKEPRAVARSEGFDFTSTLGLITFLFEEGEISKEDGIRIIRKLAHSDFRMTVGLYERNLEKLEE